jgi:hypothetical protein
MRRQLVDAATGVSGQGKRLVDLAAQRLERPVHLLSGPAWRPRPGIGPTVDEQAHRRRRRRRGRSRATSLAWAASEPPHRLGRSPAATWRVRRTSSAACRRRCRASGRPRRLLGGRVVVVCVPGAACLRRRRMPSTSSLHRHESQRRPPIRPMARPQRPGGCVPAPAGRRACRHHHGRLRRLSGADKPWNPTGPARRQGDPPARPPAPHARLQVSAPTRRRSGWPAAHAAASESPRRARRPAGGNQSAAVAPGGGTPPAPRSEGVGAGEARQAAQVGKRPRRAGGHDDADTTVRAAGPEDCRAARRETWKVNLAIPAGRLIAASPVVGDGARRHPQYAP